MLRELYCDFAASLLRRTAERKKHTEKEKEKENKKIMKNEKGEKQKMDTRSMHSVRW